MFGQGGIARAKKQGGMDLVARPILYVVVGLSIVGCGQYGPFRSFRGGKFRLGFKSESEIIVGVPIIMSDRSPLDQ